MRRRRSFGNIALVAPIDKYKRGVWNRRWGVIIRAALILVILLLVGVGVIYGPRFLSGTSTINTGSIKSDANITTASDGEIIGISDGKQLWEDAATLDTSDAETLIYQENHRVVSSTSHYITIVVSTILTGNFASSGRDSLQGAYVAQKEYNDQCLKQHNCLPARLLIANSGSGQTASDEVTYAGIVAELIVQAQRSDKSIVGIIGWPASSDLAEANAVFAGAHIPVVSPAALLSTSSPSPYIFSVAPPNALQGMAGADYAAHTLNVQHAAIFVDSGDPYSKSLADAFKQRFMADGNSTIPENYHVDVPESLQGKLQDALNQVPRPDLIYFAGHSTDIGTLLHDFPPDCQTSFCPQILGGDGLYELGGYPTIAKSLLAYVHFTSFAYPDDWRNLAPSRQQPDFFSGYPQAFNPQHISSNDGVYGFGRADSDVILSYDAMDTLLKAAFTAAKGKKTIFSPDDLQKALGQFKGSPGRQGVSGVISFGDDGNPVQKVVVVLHFDTNADIHEEQCFGSFLQSGANNVCSPLG